MSLLVQVSYNELHYGYGELNGFQDSKTLWHGHFWPQGNLVEYHLVMQQTRYKGFKPQGFRQYNFFVLPI